MERLCAIFKAQITLLSGIIYGLFTFTDTMCLHEWENVIYNREGELLLR